MCYWAQLLQKYVLVLDCAEHVSSSVCYHQNYMLIECYYAIAEYGLRSRL